MKICTVVIWYNPTLLEVKNLLPYLKVIEKTYIVDNSDRDNKNLLNGLSGNFEYIGNKENLGIAKALNIGCEKAIKENFVFALTMDQDSSFDISELTRYLSQIENTLISDSEISVFGVLTKENKKEQTGYVKRLIQSGTVINLKDFKKVKGFDNELFIDEVDFDYCYKITNLNKKIFKFNNIFLKHNLGNPIFLKKTLLKLTSNHNHIRKYYIFRNRILISKKYNHEIMRNSIVSLVDLSRIILLEKDKKKKLYYALRGILDGIKGVSGKIPF